MVITLAVIAIILLSAAYFYLKSPVIASFAMLISSIVAMAVSFSYYEPLADMLINTGRGGQWAHSGCFALLFIVTIVILRVACDYLVGANIDFGIIVTRSAAVICGLLTGMIVSGVFVITIAIMPLSQKWPYARFEVDRSPVASDIRNAAGKSFLNTDGFTAGLFSWISKGSMSSEKSFAVYHAGFLDQIHLNRLTPVKKKAAPDTNRRSRRPVAAPEVEKPTIIASSQAIEVGKTGFQMQEDNRTIIQMDISGKEIADGGSIDESGMVSFTLSQVSLVCKEKNQPLNTAGSGLAVYPEKYIAKDTSNTDGASLGELITFSRADFKGRGRTAAIKLAFDVPNSMRPVLLRFKQNAITGLPKKTTAEEAN
jgi:hypothetical protein